MNAPARSQVERSGRLSPTRPELRPRPPPWLLPLRGQEQAPPKPPKAPEPPGPGPPAATPTPGAPVNGQLHTEYHSYYVKPPTRALPPPEREEDYEEEPIELALARMPPRPKSSGGPPAPRRPPRWGARATANSGSRIPSNQKALRTLRKPAWRSRTR
ncbi:junctophilin-1a [Gadus macrocephalus]|uniref:junctophilin-1a n=1 Tax=Gadus macrocephalus TaxID=80720 RepID=UPI0028CB5AD8|nr:junctophilin-1a [Gadus macrocephalus]